MIRVVETGKNPTMRYLHRTHRISVAWLHEVFGQDFLDLCYEVSAKMCADIFTKAFTEKTSWEAVCMLINHVDIDKLKMLMDDYASRESISPAPTNGGDTHAHTQTERTNPNLSPSVVL